MPEHDADYLARFSARDYLRTYYSGKVLDDDAVILPSLSEWLRKFGGGHECSLEVGCGPTIHHAIPLTNYVQEIHLADFVPGNLNEVRLWLETAPDAHDWSGYFQEILKMEGTPAEPVDVERRTQQLRSKIKNVLSCNLLDPLPLGQETTYDLVTSFYTTECVVSTKPEWHRIMKHLLGLVRPGGSLFMASILNCERYDVMGRWFNTTPVNLDDVREALEANGFPSNHIQLHSAQTKDMADHGFSGIYLASAVKGKA